MAAERGTLVVRERKNKPPLIQIQIGDKPAMNVAAGEVSATICSRLAELAGKEVEFERVAGQPRKIREVGGPFMPPQRDASDGGRDRGQLGRAFQSGRPQSRQARRADMPRRQPVIQRLDEMSAAGPQKRDFRNPYNFVPAPPRNTSDPDLGDQRPVDQDAFLTDRYSGSIHVRLTAKTPLLVLDTRHAPKSGHKTYPLRVDAEGKPLIPASSVRGMLRSAFEAVTNSRFGRFSHEQHGDRLAFRMPAADGLRLIPARVEDGQIHLLTGTSSIGGDGRASGPMCAAWLTRYRNGRLDSNAVRYTDGTLPANGDEVKCWLELFQHHQWNRKQRRHVPDFLYWKVRQVVTAGETMGNAPAASAPANARDGRSWHQALGQPLKQVRGWVCITNANINRKHDERIFFQDASGAPGPFPVTNEHRQLWRELIQNYQSIHVEDLRKRRARNLQPEEYIGPEPGQTAWSRHVYTEADRILTDGTLCYVRLGPNQSDVEALFPVMIARELYPTTPWDLLHHSLRPAAAIDQLSPADRVFGWVKVDADRRPRSRGETVAARGLLRVGAICCESSTTDAVEEFASPGVPLAILSAPKPQQGRFYVAQFPNGGAQRDGLSKQDAGYALDKGLRGRKVYPHQASLPDGYWDDPTEDRTQQEQGTPAHYQEYRRPNNDGRERDDQNRSVLGWVKPGAQFTLDIHVLNLSEVELGALLWLLDLPEGNFFRFGGGKPLGFGSVRTETDSIDLRTAQELRERYEGWIATTPPNDPRTKAINAFRNAVVRAYPAAAGGFDDVPFIRSFLTACRGHADDLPTHYPRATANGNPGPPSPDGESFKWFVANEQYGERRALRDLASDAGLPTLPAPSGGGQRPPGQGQGREPRRDRAHGTRATETPRGSARPRDSK